MKKKREPKLIIAPFKSFRISGFSIPSTWLPSHAVRFENQCKPKIKYLTKTKNLPFYYQKPTIYLPFFCRANTETQIIFRADKTKTLFFAGAIKI